MAISKLRALHRFLRQRLSLVRSGGFGTCNKQDNVSTSTYYVGYLMLLRANSAWKTAIPSLFHRDVKGNDGLYGP